MTTKENDEEQQALGPSVVLGLVGAVVVLLLLGAGIWGVGKIISKIRDSREDTNKEQVASEEGLDNSEEGELNGDAVTDEADEVREGEGEVTTEEVVDNEDAGETEEVEETEEDSGETAEEENEESQEENEEAENGSANGGIVDAIWVVNDYKNGDIKGDSYTIIRGDTLWEIAEARYGSGFEWGKIRDVNLDKVGVLPNGSRALIIPGQVFDLP